MPAKPATPSPNERLVPDDRFWQELVDHGALDRQLVTEYQVTLAMKPWRPLGQVLLEEGLLTLKQVAALVGMQADEPGVRLGDLAVREESPGPIELMLRDHRVDDDAMVNALVGYLQHLEGKVTALREALARTT